MGRLMIALLLLSGCGKQIEIGDTLKAHKFNPDNICAAEYLCALKCDETLTTCLDIPLSNQFCEDTRTDCLGTRAGTIMDWFGEPY